MFGVIIRGSIEQVNRAFPIGVEAAPSASAQTMHAVPEEKPGNAREETAAHDVQPRVHALNNRTASHAYSPTYYAVPREVRQYVP